VQLSGIGARLVGPGDLVPQPPAMFAERESQAVYSLQEHGMTRFDAVNYIPHGIAEPQPSSPPPC
jgi:hypothetical protein